MEAWDVAEKLIGDGTLTMSGKNSGENPPSVCKVLHANPSTSVSAFKTGVRSVPSIDEGLWQHSEESFLL